MAPGRWPALYKVSSSVICVFSGIRLYRIVSVRILGMDCRGRVRRLMAHGDKLTLPLSYARLIIPVIMGREPRLSTAFRRRVAGSGGSAFCAWKKTFFPATTAPVMG